MGDYAGNGHVQRLGNIAQWRSILQNRRDEFVGELAVR